MMKYYSNVYLEKKIPALAFLCFQMMVMPVLRSFLQERVVMVMVTQSVHSLPMMTATGTFYLVSYLTDSLDVLQKFNKLFLNY